MPEKSHYIRNLTMISKFLAADFTPDGNLSKKVWKDARRVTSIRIASGTTDSLILKRRLQVSGRRVTCTWPTGASTGR